MDISTVLKSLTASRISLVSLSLAFLTLSNVAVADSKACITAHATGQREARAGHLRLATQLFTTCGSDDSCPSQLRQECAEFLRQVEQTMPTVIFVVTGEKNEDISAVKVFSTDDLIVDGLDGRAIRIDPGKHRLRFLLPSGEVLSSDVLIREGEKNRLIQMRVAEPVEPGEVAEKPEAKPEPPPPVAPPPQPVPPPAAPEPRTIPVAFWIASGVAVAGLATGTTFALMGKSEKSTLSDCAPYCKADKRGTYDDLKRDYLIADVGFAVGVVSAGVATWLYVSSQYGGRERAPASASSKSTLSRLIPQCGVTPTGGAISWSGDF
ncbi:MAG: hypothetical protein QM784_33470 [Polyangiaceae bacterium]